MSIELFFTSLFAGYWFRWILNSTHYVSLRAAGYHVLFKSILAGAVLLAIARGIFWLWDQINFAFFTGSKPVVEGAPQSSLAEVPHFIEGVLQSFSDKDPHYSGMFVLVCGLAFILPYLMNLVPSVREWSKKEKQIQRLIKRPDSPSRFKRLLHKIGYYLCCTKESAVWMDAASRGDATETAFLRSFHNLDLIELVMQDRSYIGFVMERREPPEASNMPEIGLVPLIRTYLSSKTEKLHIRVYESEPKKYVDELGRLDWNEKVVIFQLSSIRFVRRIPYDDDIENSLAKMFEETPSESRNYVANS